LARQGFNICIVSRNAAKINEKLAEIKKLYPKIETKCVAADLGKMQTMAEYHKLVADNFASMDIGYLALNAGIANGGWFALETDELLENIMILNGLHVVFLTKSLLPQLEARSKRTAIVITSSIASFVGLPRAAIYSATKAMERLFGEALHYELQHKMDVMVYTPGFVKTKLLVEAQKGRNPPLTIDADLSVAGMHRDLGRSVSSCGHWKHSLLYFALMLAPGFALKKMAAGSERRKGYKQLD
jgi:short-subunit dehydrogenase